MQRIIELYLHISEDITLTFVSLFLVNRQLIFAYLCQLPDFAIFKMGKASFFCQLMSISANAELAIMNL